MLEIGNSVTILPNVGLAPHQLSGSQGTIVEIESRETLVVYWIELDKNSLWRVPSDVYLRNNKETWATEDQLQLNS